MSNEYKQQEYDELVSWETAADMLRDKYSVKDVMMVTGLTEEQIRSLQLQLKLQ